MCGCFASEAKPIFYNGIPEKSEFLSLPEDWDHFRESSFLSAKLFFYYRYKQPELKSSLTLVFSLGVSQHMHKITNL